MEVTRYQEGETRLVVPVASVTVVPPPTAPVFFNPAASLNRDVTVAITSAAGGGTFCDAMAGVGARGIRAANEVGSMSEVSLVDFNDLALGLARRSASLNRVRGRCSFSVSETSSYLHSRFGRDQRFDFVDLDPFGSPVRQIQAGLSATAEGGVLSVTATDTAVLCGVHRSTCVRRYGSTSINNHFHHETGVRILLAALAKSGGAGDVGVEPLAAHSTRHYIRVFVRVKPGAAAADASLGELGHISWCPACGDVQECEAASTACSACGRRTRVAGPLWTGEVSDESLVEAAREDALERGLAKAAGVLGGLLGSNRFPPWSFDIDRICSGLGVPTVSEAAVNGALARAGHRAMRTPFEKTGVKTDASFTEVVRAVEEAEREGARGALRASGLRSSNRAPSSRSGSRRA